MPKFADRGVVNAASLDEPFEVEPFLQRAFKPATGPNSHHVAVKDDGGDDSRMNGGLASVIAILGFKALPVEPSENLFDSTDPMIPGHDLVDAAGKQQQLIPPNRRSRPFHDTVPAILGDDFLMKVVYQLQ